jgi:ubiquitin thioesterase OTU1
MNTSALRNLIARAVGADPIEYNDAVLGKPVHDYQKWIKNEDHWGGAIELAILSRHFQLEIAACDIKTGNMIIFGEGCGYSERIYLAYDGIHYDFLAINPVENGPEDIDITVFHPDDGWVKRAMEDTVDLLRASGLYTDTHAFRLKCGKCGHIAIGERGAMEHMQDTGHMDFDEVR